MMGAAVMMAAVGALGIKDASSVNDTGLVFIGLYMQIFAAILFCHESIQIRPCEALDNFYKRNFGFLYGPNGKGAYLILYALPAYLSLRLTSSFYSTGVMAFGIQSPRPLAIATGVVVGALGAVLILVNAKVCSCLCLSSSLTLFPH
jgi:hypothetical protein